MTSKEALERIKNHETHTTNIEFKIIEKDLEILDLIKKHPIEFSWVCRSKNYSDYILMGGTTIPFRFSDKEYKLLKELSNKKHDFAQKDINIKEWLNDK